MHDNIIQLSAGTNGTGGSVQASDVKWYANTYYLSGSAQLSNGGTVSVSQWQSAGLDTTASGTTFNSGSMPSDPSTGSTGGATPVVQTIGSGTDSLILKVSQDYYLGNAQYTVAVDGQQIGGTLTAGAIAGSGQDDLLTVKGNWAAGSHAVTVSFVNDLAGASAGQDRNLHVDGVSFAGTALANGTAVLYSNGSSNFAFTKAATATTPVVQTIGSGTDSLILKVSQDYYLGSAQYTVAVDGQQIGGTLTAGAIAGSGQDDLLTVKGNWAAGSHAVTVSFVNDLAGASAGQDRNLHVDGVSFAGTALANGTAVLYSNGSSNFAFTKAATATTPVVQTIGSGTDSLILKVSQDYYLGNAQYTVAVDGQRVGGTLTAGAIAGSGQDDLLTVKGNWAAGNHAVTVSFVNDLADALPGQDRNLHIDGVSFAGTALANGTAVLYSNGSSNFAFTKAATAGDTVPAISFGTPGTWGQDSSVWQGHATYGGEDFHTFRATPAWGGVVAAQTAPTSWATTNATHLAFDNFQQVQLTLSAAGTTGLDVTAVAAKSGNITTGGGNDTITWVAHSNASGTGNIMTIHTGAGNDTVHITAVGLSPLAASHATGDGSLYNAAYTGSYSTADVYLGSGNDTVTTEGATRLVLHGAGGYAIATGGSRADIFYAGTGRGDFTGGGGNDTYVLKSGVGHITVEDFATGYDHLKFVGLTASGVTSKLATENGVAGLLVTYDAVGDSVFLAHATKLGATDMVFA
ncbi:beta strand repeat-containing protein [Dankookia sp. P2]|uniref:beta strand repeat-containing protein n=1 Tax=Dankookia sp. P2 TaxID=3423955 RepID=UPI003D6697F7